MKINIKMSSIVGPVEDTPNQRLWVSKLDLLQRRSHVPLVYFYKPTGSYSSNFFETKVLKEALSKVLVPFYPVAGRLARDQKGRIEINCSGEGALFIEAETDSAMADLVEFMPSSELEQLIPKVDYSRDMSSYPLLLLQVTTFKCGGVCLGVGFHHTLGDGTAGTHLINTWSEVARGLSISIPTFIDRTILCGRVPPKPSFHHIEYDQPPTMNIIPNKKPGSQSGSNAISMKILRITLDQLDILMAKTMTNENKTKYSTYEILTAHIWHCTCKARGLCDNQATKLYITTSGRPRLHPPLPSGYFGNVVFSATPIALSGDLILEPFTHTVERIHKAIKRMDNEYLRSALDYLDELDDIKAIVRGPHICASPNLNIVSWMRLPLYQADFGWGRPMYVCPANAFEGKGYILPSPTNDGSLSLAICLETVHMQSFQKLFSFMTSCL